MTTPASSTARLLGVAASTLALTVGTAALPAGPARAADTITAADQPYVSYYRLDELHAAGLSANQEMLAQLRAAHRRGVAIYAECGGLMYLGTTLEVTSGERYTMADIIPGHSRMGTRLTRFGYCEAQAQQQTLLAAPGEWLRGHEFHYSDFSPATPAVLACRKQRDGKTLQQWQGGWQSGSAFASYLHVHFAQRPTMLNHWLRAARRAL